MREKTSVTSVGEEEIYCEFFKCSKCPCEGLTKDDTYCSNCGREIKWEKNQ